MKRLMLAVSLAAMAAVPARGQFWGTPNWNSPKGGTGVTLSADLGLPNADVGGPGAGKGTAYGVRGTLGLANLSLTAGFSSWTPDGAPDAYSSVGGNAAFRVIGGSLLPVALNLQVGAARIPEANGDSAFTRITAGAGVSAKLPTPGISIEPYLSLTNRWYATSGFDTESQFGWTLGANADFGMFGLHAAYDSEDYGTGVTGGIFGIGAHVQLKVPLGM